MSEDLASQIVAVLSRLVPKVAALEEKFAALDQRITAHQEALQATVEKRGHLSQQISEQLSTMVGSLR